MKCFKCRGLEFDVKDQDVEQALPGGQGVMRVNTPVSVCRKCGWMTLGPGQAEELKRRAARQRLPAPRGSNFIVDLSELPTGVIEEFRKGRLAREVATIQQAPKLQDLAAREHNYEHRSTEGLGRVRMVVTPDAFHYWGRRFSYDAAGNYIGDGYKCWKDAQFLREFERDNPAARVKCRGTKIQVGYRPSLTMQLKYPVRAAAGSVLVS